MTKRLVRRGFKIIKSKPPAEKKPPRHEELQPLVKFLLEAGCGRASMVEVGTNRGDAVFLWREMFRKVYAVDPWDPEAYAGSDAVNDKMAKRTRSKFSEVERHFDRRFGDDRHVVKIKAYSVPAAKDWESPVDFVYIDAVHDYKNVTADIAAWRPHCRRFIGGHDYHQEVWPGVFQAVNEAFGAPHMVFPDTSWVVDLSRI